MLEGGKKKRGLFLGFFRCDVSSSDTLRAAGCMTRELGKREGRWESGPGHWEKREKSAFR